MRIVQKVAKLLGWSPVGKTIVIHIDDTGLASLTNRSIKGHIVDVRDDKLAIIDLEAPLRVKDADVTRLGALQRHEDFDFYRLPFSWVAVNLFVCAKEKETDIKAVKHEDVFAIATIKLA